MGLVDESTVLRELVAILLVKQEFDNVRVEGEQREEIGLLELQVTVEVHFDALLLLDQVDYIFLQLASDDGLAKEQLSEAHAANLDCVQVLKGRVAVVRSMLLLDVDRQLVVIVCEQQGVLPFQLKVDKAGQTVDLPVGVV